MMPVSIQTMKASNLKTLSSSKNRKMMTKKSSISVMKCWGRLPAKKEQIMALLSICEDD